MMENRRVVPVTGASSGIGKATAAHLAGLGFQVFGASRSAAAPVQRLGALTLLSLDVRDDAPCGTASAA